MSKHYYTQEKREKICKEYRASGKTQKEFCAVKVISQKTLSRWLNEKKNKPIKFVSVGEVRPMLGLAEIILPNAIKIRLPIEAGKISSIAQGLLSCK